MLPAAAVARSRSFRVDKKRRLTMAALERAVNGERAKVTRRNLRQTVQLMEEKGDVDVRRDQREIKTITLFSYLAVIVDSGGEQPRRMSGPRRGARR